MGSFLTKIFDKLTSKKEYRILMLGLDGAGKTTILYNMKLGAPISTVPTIGFNYETVEYKNIKFNVWDVGGQDKIRLLWKHYFINSKALIFVVDSSDIQRIEEVKEVIQSLFQEEELYSVPTLILANKQDISLMKADELFNKLGLLENKGRNIHIQETCGLNGFGINEGFDWLVKKIKK